MRYFKNPFPDYSPSSANLTFDRQLWCKILLNEAENIIRHVPCNSKTADGALYVGSPGIGYALWYVARTAAEDVLSSEHRNSFRQKGLEYCESYFSSHRRDPNTSFLCGAAGVHVAAALLAHDLNEADVCQKHVDAFNAIGVQLKPVDFFKHGSDEMLVGRAGYLAAALQLARFLPSSLNRQTVRELYQSMIESGLKYSARNRSSSPLMYSYYGSECLGAAHGLSGILQELLSCSALVNCIDEPPSVRASVDYLLSTKQNDSNYAPATDEITQPRPKEDALVHWCHGAPGVVYCMAMAYRRFKDEKYLNAIIEAGNMVWERGLLRKGPGICHGVAGSGYVHLLCHRLATTLAEKQKHLYRATKFCEFMLTDEFRNQARTPDCPWSLYEGWSGTLCFICDLVSNPDKAEFPFSDVFSF